MCNLSAGFTNKLYKTKLIYEVLLGFSKKQYYLCICKYKNESMKKNIVKKCRIFLHLE